MGCGYKDELKYLDNTSMLVAKLKPLYWNAEEA